MHALPSPAGVMAAWLVRAGLLAGLQDPALSAVCATLMRRDAPPARAAATPTTIMTRER